MATINREEVKERVRFLLGDVSTSVLSEATLDMILDDCINEYGDDDTYLCEITYCTLLESLRYLIRKNQAESGVLGQQRRRKEVRGKTTIEVEYGDSTDYVTSGWQEMYTDYINHPEYVCDSLKSDTYVSLVKIGGVRQDEYLNIEGNLNSRSGWDVESRSKFGSLRTERRRRALSRSKSGYYTKRNS